MLVRVEKTAFDVEAWTWANQVGTIDTSHDRLHQRHPAHQHFCWMSAEYKSGKACHF